MKKQSFVLSVLFYLCLAVGGCGAHRSTSPGTTPNDYRACPRPNWVDSVGCEGGLCAIGVAKSMDYGFAREKAEAAARNQLASALDVEVRNLFEQLKEENRNFIDDAASSGLEFTSSVTQQLTATIMSGSTATNYYSDCVTGDVYALMVLNFDLLESNLKRAVQTAAEQTQTFNRELTRQAVDRMNVIIDQRRDEKFASRAGSLPVGLR